MRISLSVALWAVIGAASVATCDAQETFTDLGNGTTRQNSTGLIWLTNPTTIPKANSMNGAQGVVAELKSGQHGLSDGSTSGNWRLPNAEEMVKLANEAADAADNEDYAILMRFTPNGESRGYIGTGTARIGSDRSIFGQGFPSMLKWVETGGFGAGHYVWPVKKVR